MKTISVVSLAGGQGKSTVALMLSRLLAKHSRATALAIDLDPQANLTLYLGHTVTSNDPTLLEVVTGEVEALDAVYSVSDRLFLMPADDGLERAKDYLASSGNSAMGLKRRLRSLKDQDIDYIVCDSPPQRSHLAIAALGAASHVVIPAEATLKGVESLSRTLALIDEMRDLESFSGQVLGALPFRDRWVGNTQTRDSRDCVELMGQFGIPVLPSIVESQKYKEAIRTQKLPSDLGYGALEYPIEKLMEALQ